ncbi:MAG: tRNA (guanosine(37)-N1)-methyltransferase TrmD [Crocinitomicaceae bacterium]
MRIDILTVLPELLTGPFNHSILLRAQEKGKASVHLHNIRDYSTHRQKSVDDYQYGGGAGMVMTIQPIANCINKLKTERDYDEIIYMTPDGDLFDQKTANQLSLGENLIIICGHYKGVDQRVRDLFVTKEISVGSYVLSGGELGAAIVSDAVIRLIPGVLNNETSALTDSFQDNLLAPPVYTRPRIYEGHEVPPILLSGDDKKIEQWRMDQAFENTKKRRPDLLD